MAQLVCNANTWRTLAWLVPSAFISHYVFEMWGNVLQICSWTRKYLRNILSCVMSEIQRDMKLWHHIPLQWFYAGGRVVY